jgi:hypothetical protein
MSRRGRGRIVFGLGFVVLLFDGAAAVWLGQVSARPLLVGVGLALIAAAAAVVVAYRRWLRALEAVDAARAELREEIRRLRDAVAAARGSGPGLN